MQRLAQEGADGSQLRKVGLYNDMDRFAAQGFDTACEGVACPTLICHGTADNDVPFAQAENSHSRIAGSELFALQVRVCV